MVCVTVQSVDSGLCTGAAMFPICKLYSHRFVHCCFPDDVTTLTTVYLGPNPVSIKRSILAVQMDIKVALSNSFGFGGHNSCILFKAFES